MQHTLRAAQCQVKEICRNNRSGFKEGARPSSRVGGGGETWKVTGTKLCTREVTVTQFVTWEVMVTSQKRRPVVAFFDFQVSVVSANFCEEKFPVQPRDVRHRDFLRTFGLARVVVGTVAEPFLVHLLDHLEDTLLTLDFPLRQ